jgi:ABC-type phosphate transport system substrate-binding protein
LKILHLISILSILLVYPVFAEEHSISVIFIVHPENPLKELSTQEVSDFYFKRNRYWPDGTKVRFFDQKSSSPERLWFIQKILKKTPRELDLFWIGEKNFNGQGAPIIAPNDDMVVSSVATVPGAIGYVSGDDADLDLSHVKKIVVKVNE